jgi:RNA-directed DNA polymerase
MLQLIKMWLKAPIEVTDQAGGRRLEGGKKSKRGTPQGGVLSPLLANIYMHRFIRAFRKHGIDGYYGAVLVNYADDFVVLCRRRAREALAVIRRWFSAMGLQLNDVKSSVKNACRESFDFLGYTFKRLRSYKTGTSYPGATPSKKAIMGLKDNVRSWVTRQNVRPLAEVVRVLNQKLRGWANYFRVGSVVRVRHNLDRFVANRMRQFLRRRNKLQTGGWRRFGPRQVFGELGVVSLEALPRRAANALP